MECEVRDVQHSLDPGHLAYKSLEVTVPHIDLLGGGRVKHPAPIRASQVGKSGRVAILLTKNVVRLVFLVRVEDIDDPGTILEVLVMR